MAVFSSLGAIVLGAGFSRRMGPENKLLKPLGGRPLLSHVLGGLGDLGLGQILVVGGESAALIAPLLPPGAGLIVNEHAAEGMGRSIACAAPSLYPTLRGAFVVLGDMPFVTRQDYTLLAAALGKAGDQAICIPHHQGRRGNPVLFGRAYFPALARLSGDIGARALITGGDARIIQVDGCSAGVLADLDDPAAFAEAEQRLLDQGCPSRISKNS